MEDSIASKRSVQSQFCGQCGKESALSASFCGGCGTGLGAEVVVNEVDSPRAEKSLTLTEGWACFLGGYVLLAFVCALSANAGVVAYFIIGIFMSRFVMRRLVEWHPIYNTVDNVLAAKIWMILLWPLRMFILLLKLSANKVL